MSDVWQFVGLVFGITIVLVGIASFSFLLKAFEKVMDWIDEW